MKILRILSLVLVLAMTIGAFGTTAIAAEEAETNEATVLEFEITSEMPDSGVIAVPMDARSIDQSFNMTTSHRGADRTYSGTTLGYGVTITGADGNACDATVTVALWDYNHGTAIKADSVRANGSLYYFTCPITSGRVYYFRYTKTSGTAGTLTVRMQIHSY